MPYMECLYIYIYIYFLFISGLPWKLPLKPSSRIAKKLRVHASNCASVVFSDPGDTTTTWKFRLAQLHQLNTFFGGGHGACFPRKPLPSRSAMSFNKSVLRNFTSDNSPKYLDPAVAILSPTLEESNTLGEATGSRFAASGIPRRGWSFTFDYPKKEQLHHLLQSCLNVSVSKRPCKRENNTMIQASRGQNQPKPEGGGLIFTWPLTS